MTGAQFIVDRLIKRGVTDAFGIPGGVILKLIYAMDEREEELMPHLSYHEQAAGFAACGYAQASGKLGVAYATRGPGFTNLVSAIADAYYDSLPVLFITAHAADCPPTGMRVMADQEMDTCSMVRNITKEALRIDDAETFPEEFERICEIALAGRKGPVFIDISSNLLNQEIHLSSHGAIQQEIKAIDDVVINDIVSSIRNAKRPIVLVGDGVNQAGARQQFVEFVRQVSIPVVSSRFSHDILGNNDLYYGYVGSHGTRIANFILSKADLIISVGNRLHFPAASQTFGEIFSHARLIRCDIDNNEFKRNIPNSVYYQLDVFGLLDKLTVDTHDYGLHKDWIRVCDTLRQELLEEDMNVATKQIAVILKHVSPDWSVVNDVGNNEFWVSRASVYIKGIHRTYYSKSFGALGCGLGKAIGVCYATRKPVLCFVGDQGLQINIQELQFIAQHRLPIMIMLVNNTASGMIRDRELTYRKFLHTTQSSGFGSPNYKGIAKAYGLSYYQLIANEELDSLVFNDNLPKLMEMRISEDLSLTPNLPRGAKCQDMQPALAKEKYEYLNAL